MNQEKPLQNFQKNFDRKDQVTIYPPTENRGPSNVSINAIGVLISSFLTGFKNRGAQEPNYPRCKRKRRCGLHPQHKLLKRHRKMQRHIA